MPSAAERALVAKGRPTARCPVDDTVFDPRTSYAGRPSNRRRGYCRLECKRQTRNARGRAERKVRAENAGLFRMHEQERAGQVPLLVDPLPPAPAVDDDRVQVELARAL